MFRKSLIAVGIAGALAVLSGPVGAVGPSVRNNAVEIVGAGAVADPLVAVEANRSALVQRLVAQHREAAFVHGVAETAFQNALLALRSDQLLAAALVSSFEEVSAIVAQAPVDGITLQRYVALTPVTPTTMDDVPLAQAYLIREQDVLNVVRAHELPFGQAHVQVVGYFVPAASTTVTSAASPPIVPKDGSGSGPNSWIGYVAGNNLATGSGSAVAAGTFNLASGQGSFVGAGQSNRASGTSSLVIGGFDNWATAIDSVVIGGAGHRSTGARSFIGGGGYNLASGQWSAIVGGGRDGTVSTPAGTDAKDHIASGDFSFIGGGQGNRAGTSGYSTVAGGQFNTASGSHSVVAGGESSVASAGWSAIAGGFANVASGLDSFVGGGSLNVASGASSVAMGRQARTEDVTPTPHNGAFVYSDGSSGNFRSTASNSFNVLATGGARFVTAATNTAGEAVADRVVQILAGTLDFPESTQNRQAITMRSLGTGIGAQPSTLYLRTDSDVQFYLGGGHSDTAGSPGSGGSRMATLSTASLPDPVVGIFRAQTITATSDRNAKTLFEMLSPKAILDKVARMPIMSWAYKTESASGIRHIGPTAQDFKRLFNVGYDDKSIATVDADGVALAAIQGLKQELDEKNAKLVHEVDEKNVRIMRLERDLDARNAHLARLERDIDAIKARLGLK